MWFMSVLKPWYYACWLTWYGQHEHPHRKWPVEILLLRTTCIKFQQGYGISYAFVLMHVYEDLQAHTSAHTHYTFLLAASASSLLYCLSVDQQKDTYMGGNPHCLSCPCYHNLGRFVQALGKSENSFIKWECDISVSGRGLGQHIAAQHIGRCATVHWCTSGDHGVYVSLWQETFILKMLIKNSAAPIQKHIGGYRSIAGDMAYKCCR